MTPLEDRQRHNGIFTLSESFCHFHAIRYKHLQDLLLEMAPQSDL